MSLSDLVQCRCGHARHTHVSTAEKLVGNFGYMTVYGHCRNPHCDCPGFWTKEGRTR